MKTIIAIMILGTMILSSCSNSAPTQKEIEEKQKICDINGEKVYIYEGVFWGSNMVCRTMERVNSTMDCIREYTNGLDEKYNNPDTVSNLSEDDYSKVVKTCNEIFGEKQQVK